MLLNPQSTTEEIMIQIKNRPILRIVCYLHQLIPQFYFIIAFQGYQSLDPEFQRWILFKDFYITLELGVAVTFNRYNFKN